MTWSICYLFTEKCWDIIVVAISPLALPSFSYQGHFIVWEGAPGARMAWKGHKRHVFLFKNYIVICKPKRDTRTDTYSYIFKNIMKVWSLYPHLEHFSVIENVMFIPSLWLSKWDISLTLLSCCFVSESLWSTSRIYVYPQTRLLNLSETIRSMGGFLWCSNDITSVYWSLLPHWVTSISSWYWCEFCCL